MCIAMSLSIVIPAYNAANTLAQTLKSLLAQTTAAWEAIIVDDGSTDETGEIATRYAKRDRRIHTVNRSRGRKWIRLQMPAALPPPFSVVACT